jgi:hypothetical protein
LVLLLVSLILAVRGFHIDPNGRSVSGVSSGGYMAVQVHVAFSSLLKGAGVVAGGPFFCSNADIEIALTACMRVPEMIVLSELYFITSEFESHGYIDKLDNLKNDKVWMFSGTKDTEVYQGVMKKLNEYYGHYITDTSNLVTLFNYSAEHSFVTNNYGNDCSYLGSPYINNCHLDGAGQILNHIHGPLKPPTTMKKSNIFSFSQSTYTPSDPKGIGMDTTGYAYVPTGCQSSTATCKLHIAFHGCEQGHYFLKDTYYMHTGYNEWAESNNIVIVYPQIYPTYEPLNPMGCWDWWGYTGLTTFCTKSGAQMKTMSNILTKFNIQNFD